MLAPVKLRFECTLCGRCCLGTGAVRVTEQEVAAIQALFPLPREQLVVESDAGLMLRSIRDGAEDRCVLLGADGKCRAYDARPAQCRAFPFWPQYLGSQAAWDDLAAHCEGIGRGPEMDPVRAREIAAGMARTHAPQSPDCT